MEQSMDTKYYDTYVSVLIKKTAHLDKVLYFLKEIFLPPIQLVPKGTIPNIDYDIFWVYENSDGNYYRNEIVEYRHFLENGEGVVKLHNIDKFIEVVDINSEIHSLLVKCDGFLANGAECMIKFYNRNKTTKCCRCGDKKLIQSEVVHDGNLDSIDPLIKLFAEKNNITLTPGATKEYYLRILKRKIPNNV
jgi:hypothetical protein